MTFTVVSELQKSRTLGSLETYPKPYYMNDGTSDEIVVERLTSRNYEDKIHNGIIGKNESLDEVVDEDMKRRNIKKEGLEEKNVKEQENQVVEGRKEF